MVPIVPSGAVRLTLFREPTQEVPEVLTEREQRMKEQRMKEQRLPVSRDLAGAAAGRRDAEGKSCSFCLLCETSPL